MTRLLTLVSVCVCVFSYKPCCRSMFAVLPSLFSSLMTSKVITFYSIRLAETDACLRVTKRRRGCRRRPRRRAPSCRTPAESDPWQSWTWRWGWGWWWRRAPSCRARCRSAPRRTLKHLIHWSLLQVRVNGCKVFLGVRSIFGWPRSKSAEEGYNPVCKVSPLVRSIFSGQNDDLTSGRNCS